ncbi:MAG: gliding motility-associated C-terminal domain-containing protein [Chitinophagia bacterium]|nr:gliding motility-associated C-terminal domain-containing protein [Chitinophagia bacterium]
MRFTYKHITLVITFLMATASACLAQLTVYPSSTAALLTAKLTGPGITIISDTLICNTAANGTFVSVSTPIALDSGILLSTGRAASASGPESGVTSTSFSGAGDADFTSALLGTTSISRDACALIINFVPKGDTVRFNYQFGSEEYINSTCGSYNDAFAFWISGPGVSSSLPGVNMALVPGTSIPITVNSVNSGTPCGSCSISTCNAMGSGSPFTAYYINNTGGTSISYRGYTRVLTAKHWVIPCDTYRIKMAIVDALNYTYDSGVFIEAGSLKSNVYQFNHTFGSTVLSVPNTLVKGCSPDSLKVTSEFAVSYPVTLRLSYGGTAFPGIDYATLPDSIVIPAGATRAALEVMPLRTSTTGTKTLIAYLTSAASCGVIDSILITILDEPSVNMITRDTTICTGRPLRIAATSSAGLSYSWSPATYLDNPAILNPTSTPGATTTYTLTAVLPGAPCPSISKVLTINAVNPIFNILTPDTTICQGSSFTIRVNGEDSIAYNWLPATGLNSGAYKQPVASPTSTTIYTLTGTFPRLGCTATAPLNVTVIPTDFVISTRDTAVCSGNNLTLYATINPSSGLYTYLWSGPGGYSSILLNPVITTVSEAFTGTYTIKVTLNGLCSKDTTLRVTVNPSPNAPILARPIEVCYLAPAMPLHVEGYSNLLWYSSETDSVPSVVPPYPRMDTLGKQRFFASQISFDNNCIGFKVPIDIEVVSCCNGAVYIPNAFSPNNDGLNDYFRVDKTADYALHLFEVYDRWGNLIFHATNDKPYWDGTYKGEPADVNTYHYVARLNCITGKEKEILLKGTVNLVR